MQTLKTTTTKTKRRLALFVALVMLLSLWVALPQGANAADPDDGHGVYTNADGFEYTVTDGAATIIDYVQGEETDIAFPAFVAGSGNEANIPVVTINAGAFFNNTSVTSITIPEGVTTIGGYAFYGCTSLESVTIADSVKSIGVEAFFYCRSLETVKGMKGVTSLGDRAFCQCTSLPSITLPAGVKVLGNRLFEGDVSLASITIPEGVTTIDAQAFQSCTSLTSIDIPDSVTSIANGAFAYCTGLETVEGMEGLSALNAGVFSGCTSLTSITIPSKITSINTANTFSFVNCSALTDIVVPGTSTNFQNQQVNNITGITALDKIWIRSDMPSNYLRTYATNNSKLGFLLDTILVDSTLALSVGTSKTLDVSYTPDDPKTEPRVIAWTSSNKAAATVDANGTVTAVGAGSATIIATATSISGQTVLPASCTVTVTAAANSITSFKLGDYKGIITNDASTPTTKASIDITVPYGTNITDVIPVITKSNGATIANETTPQTFTSPVDYVVNSTKTYTVNVTVLPATKDITSFTLAGVSGIITDSSATAGTIAVTVPDGTNITGVVPQIVHNGKSIAPTTAQDFTNNIPYQVTGADDSQKTYTVTVTVAPSSAKDIETFSLAGVEGVIKGKVISVTLPYGTAVTQLAPEITLSDKASVDPLSGANKDFTGSVGYTVTAEDGSRKVYTSYVKFAPPSTARDITSFKIGTAVGNINGTNISVTVPEGTDVTGLAPDIEVSDKASVDPATGTPRNFTNPADYTVTAQNSNFTKVYTVTVTVGSPAPTTYKVTVTGGTDGANGPYAEGATVNITANAPASGKVFDTWTSSDGVTFANANNAATSFVMPAKAVTVTATYKDETVDPPVNPPAEDNGWVYANGTWKFYTDGEAVTGWIHDGKAWYYTNANGEMQTGWIYDQNKWYYLAGNGAMKTGWVQTDGSWYYLSGNGAMIAGKWFKDTDGSWYYLSGNGKMLTGKHKIGGKAYTFKANGVWIG
jgi:hypothetical protein